MLRHLSVLLILLLGLTGCSSGLATTPPIDTEIETAVVHPETGASFSLNHALSDLEELLGTGQSVTDPSAPPSPFDRISYPEEGLTLTVNRETDALGSVCLRSTSPWRLLGFSVADPITEIRDTLGEPAAVKTGSYYFLDDRYQPVDSSRDAAYLLRVQSPDALELKKLQLPERGIFFAVHEDKRSIDLAMTVDEVIDILDEQPVTPTIPDDLLEAPYQSGPFNRLRHIGEVLDFPQNGVSLTVIGDLILEMVIYDTDRPNGLDIWAVRQLTHHPTLDYMTARTPAIVEPYIYGSPGPSGEYPYQNRLASQYFERDGTFLEGSVGEVVVQALLPGQEGHSIAGFSLFLWLLSQW